MRYSLLKGLLCIGLAGCAAYSFAQSNSGKIDESNDFPIHTTIYHNDHGKTLAFQVTFSIGYYNAKTKTCQIQKERKFQATHPDGKRALTLGKHLANEYGPELYTCVHETLHVISSHDADEAMTYQITNNGKYYTSAIPNINHVYPHS